MLVSSGEFHYRGVLERAEKIAFLRGLDVMSMPATYDEPKGVSLLEAMACGVPLVQPRRGAFTEIVKEPVADCWSNPTIRRVSLEGILKIARDTKLAQKTEREWLSRRARTALQRRAHGRQSAGVLYEAVKNPSYPFNPWLMFNVPGDDLIFQLESGFRTAARARR